MVGEHNVIKYGRKLLKPGVPKVAHGHVKVDQSEEFRESLTDVFNPINFAETLVKRILF